LFAVLEDINFSPGFRSATVSSAAVYCTVGVDAYSLVGVLLLDFFYKSNPSGPGLLKFRPYIKETARHVPLSSDSYHPWAVHKGWPVAEMLRMDRRASERETGRIYQELKLQRFSRYMLDPTVLQACHEWRRKCKSLVAGAVLCKASQCNSRICRIVLPFRKELSLLPSLLRAIAKRMAPYVVGETGLDILIQVSWARAGKPLATLL
jgi:hypothetical protein